MILIHSFATRARAYIHPSIDANARVSRVVFFHGVRIDRSFARAVARAERSSTTRPRDDDDGYETFKKSSPDSQMTVPSH